MTPQDAAPMGANRIGMVRGYVDAMSAPKSITDNVAMTTEALIERRLNHALEPLVGLPVDMGEIEAVMERVFFDLIAEFED